MFILKEGGGRYKEIKQQEQQEERRSNRREKKKRRRGRRGDEGEGRVEQGEVVEQDLLNRRGIGRGIGTPVNREIKK